MAEKKMTFKIKPKGTQTKKSKVLKFKISKPKKSAKVTKKVEAVYAVPPRPKKSTAKKVTKKAPSTIKTKGGEYPVYKKKSKSAQNFRSAFAAAKKAGKKTFTWQGRKYTTKTK